SFFSTRVLNQVIILPAEGTSAHIFNECVTLFPVDGGPRYIQADIATESDQIARTPLSDFFGDFITTGTEDSANPLKEFAERIGLCGRGGSRGDESCESEWKNSVFGHFFHRSTFVLLLTRTGVPAGSSQKGRGEPHRKRRSRQIQKSFHRGDRFQLS